MTERGWWPEERVALEEELTQVQVRVLGCLMEKQATTPDYYPLTLNALVTACNQTSNREPVVTYDASIVTEALDDLRARKLTRIVHSPSARAPKFRHVLDEALGIDEATRAVLTVMMLRGPQTLGELRTRTERMHTFESTAEVESLLQRLASADPPLVVKIERQPGQKEARYAHLLAGTPDPASFSRVDDGGTGGGGGGGGSGGMGAGSGGGSRSALQERVAELEARVETLERTLADLQRQLGD